MEWQNKNGIARVEGVFRDTHFFPPARGLWSGPLWPTMAMAQWMTMATTAAADNDNNDKNLPLRVGKRNDVCNETKTEEEETVADSVAIHTTIKQITGRGGGRWR